MNLLTLTILVLALLVVGYFTYGAFIARIYRLDDARTTPAVRHADGVDFVPSRPFPLLAQHFSAIAAAGPIIGPIAAGMAFGWLPCVLWIVVGVIFIGAVHDFSALVASVRHGANSICEIARQNLGRRAYLALAAFIWLALLYVILAFTSVTAGTFHSGGEDLAGVAVDFNKGGAVAAASTVYLILALLMGLVQRLLRPPLWLMTVIFVPATLAAVWIGTRADHLLLMDERSWHIAILVYCFIASLLPMWLLQQPRGYLGGFVLFLAIAAGLAGVLFGGFRINQPAIVHHEHGLWAFLAGEPNAPAMTHLAFPFLFVTIACGACSGFHGLICGGTTSKQVARESHCKPIGFGAMLLEGLVAVIALATLMVLTPEEARGRPHPVIYGDGLARFIAALFGPETSTFARTFGAMAFSTFVFDTLDVSTRLGRYLLQEVTGIRGRAAAVVAAAATAGIPLAILSTADSRAFQQFWTLFGTSNQLLAALTLLGVTVWLARTGRRWWFTAIPMVLVMVVTVSALALQILVGVRVVARDGPALTTPVINAAVALLLLGFAAVFVMESWRSFRAMSRPGTYKAAEPEPRC